MNLLYEPVNEIEAKKSILKYDLCTAIYTHGSIHSILFNLIAYIPPLKMLISIKFNGIFSLLCYVLMQDIVAIISTSYNISVHTLGE